MSIVEVKELLSPINKELKLRTLYIIYPLTGKWVANRISATNILWALRFNQKILKPFFFPFSFSYHFELRYINFTVFPTAMEIQNSHPPRMEVRHDHDQHHSKRSRKMIGKYYLTKTVGRGSTGKVKLAINTVTNEKVTTNNDFA